MRLKWAPVDLEWNSGMWNSGQIQSILDGAQDPQQSAVGRLDQGDTRDAAEKAWGATKRATGALILARTGEFPETTAGTTRMLMDLAGTSAGLETLASQCFTRISYPHQLPARLLLPRRAVRSRHRPPDHPDIRLHPGRPGSGRQPLSRNHPRGFAGLATWISLTPAPVPMG